MVARIGVLPSMDLIEGVVAQELSAERGPIAMYGFCREPQQGVEGVPSDDAGDDWDQREDLERCSPQRVSEHKPPEVDHDPAENDPQDPIPHRLVDEVLRHDE